MTSIRKLCGSREAPKKITNKIEVSYIYSATKKSSKTSGESGQYLQIYHDLQACSVAERSIFNVKVTREAPFQYPGCMRTELPYTVHVTSITHHLHIKQPSHAKSTIKASMIILTSSHSPAVLALASMRDKEKCVREKRARIDIVSEQICPTPRQASNMAAEAAIATHQLKARSCESVSPTWLENTVYQAHLQT